MIDDITNGKY